MYTFSLKEIEKIVRKKKIPRKYMILCKYKDRMAQIIPHKGKSIRKFTKNSASN